MGTVCVIVRHKGGLFSVHSGETWAETALVGLWIAFAGHWIEIFYLNFLRRKLPRPHLLHLVARLAVWFIGGIVLSGGMILFRPVESTLGLPAAPWWTGGILFIGVELFMHLFALQLRNRPSFYNGRG